MVLAGMSQVSMVSTLALRTKPVTWRHESVDSVSRYQAAPLMNTMTTDPTAVMAW